VIAVVLRTPGTAPALEHFAEPVASDGQLVVEVLAAGLNPVDLIRMYEGALPCVPGNEGVARLPGGERAYFERTLAPFGSFAERALVAADLPIPLPEELSSGAALAIGIAGLAGWLSLERQAKLQPGERVLVLGASGAVGRIAVQAARLLGAGRIVAAARDVAAIEPLRGRGADELVALGGDCAPALKAAAGDGFDVVIDPLFGEPLVAALAATAPGARVVSLGSSAADTATIPRRVLAGRQLLTYGNRTTPVAVKRAAYERMCRHVLAGELVVEHESVALADFAEAFAAQARHPHCKLVLIPSDGGEDSSIIAAAGSRLAAAGREPDTVKKGDLP
jgi:NADPH:quinone reductase-like Zn-dependent oxidoreductase